MASLAIVWPPRPISGVSSMELRELEHPPQSYDKNISNVTTYLSLALYFTLKIDLHFSMLLIKYC